MYKKNQEAALNDSLSLVFSLVQVLNIPIQIGSVDLAISHTVMLNLFQHLKEIPKQVRDDNREKSNILI